MDREELTTLAAELGRGFEEFKRAHVARVDEIEKRLARMASFGGSAGMKAGGTVTSEAAAALGAFVRRGDEAELKAMAVGADPDGGYLVSPALSESLIVKSFDVSPVGRLARRVTIGAGDAYEEPIDADEAGAAWVGETAARPATTTPELQLLRVPVHELYSLQPVTQRLLDDSRFDVGAWVTEKISSKFAREFGAAFVRGDGVARPRGLLSYPTSTLADGVRPWLTIQHVNTGEAASFPAATTTVSPADCLIDLVHALRAPYRPNARWTMNRTTAGVVRKLKDSEGRFVWADAREGQPATLLGYPVELDEEMPNVQAGAFPIAFGDFQAAYTIVEKPGVRLLRDPYSSKPNVLFYAYGRIGGGLANGEAIKLLRVAASG